MKKRCRDCIHDDVCNDWAVTSGIPFVNPDTCKFYREKKQGEWRDCHKINYECSICKTKSFHKFKYCPECGAKMKGGEQG